MGVFGDKATECPELSGLDDTVAVATVFGDVGICSIPDVPEFSLQADSAPPYLAPTAITAAGGAVSVTQSDGIAISATACLKTPIVGTNSYVGDLYLSNGTTITDATIINTAETAPTIQCRRLQVTTDEPICAAAFDVDKPANANWDGTWNGIPNPALWEASVKVLPNHETLRTVVITIAGPWDPEGNDNPGMYIGEIQAQDDDGVVASDRPSGTFKFDTSGSCRCRVINLPEAQSLASNDAGPYADRLWRDPWFDHYDPGTRFIGVVIDEQDYNDGVNDLGPVVAVSFFPQAVEILEGKVTAVNGASPGLATGISYDVEVERQWNTDEPKLTASSVTPHYRPWNGQVRITAASVNSVCHCKIVPNPGDTPTIELLWVDESPVFTNDC